MTTKVSLLIATLATIVAAPVSAEQTRATAPPPASAATYAEKAAQADFLETRASQVALEKLRYLDLRQFARTMIDHHTMSSDALKTVVRMANHPAPVPPPALDPAQRRMLDLLRSAPPETADQVYLDLQMKAHEEALKLHRYFAEYGDDPALRRAAAERVRLVSHHLAEIERMAHNLVASAAR